MAGGAWGCQIFVRGRRRRWRGGGEEDGTDAEGALVAHAFAGHDLCADVEGDAADGPEGEKSYHLRIVTSPEGGSSVKAARRTC